MMAVIRKLNYQHLLYFWSVVRTGSLTRACEELALSPPTISAQLRTLEARLGEKLLSKTGRTLVPTEVGRLVYTYADEIFGIGRDLVDALEHRPTRRPLRVIVGIDDVVPKAIDPYASFAMKERWSGCSRISRYTRSIWYCPTGRSPKN
jgi:LysR family transcriptional regulator, transcriptional activator of nhaA